MSSILLVEDDKWWAENCRRILERSGYEVMIAESAHAALQTLTVAIPQLIMLDFMLPGANALQLLHELQSYSDTQTVPVILCTSVSEARSSVTAFENYGVRFVFNKATVTPVQLVKAVKAVLV